jgi:hypothetical protein
MPNSTRPNQHHAAAVGRDRHPPRDLRPGVGVVGAQAEQQLLVAFRRAGQQAAVDARHRVQVVDQHAVDLEAHRHPADDQRRAHRHHHELVGPVAHQRHRAAAFGQPRRDAAQHGQRRLRRRALAVRQVTHRQARVQQRRHRGTDARAVVVQRGLDGGAVVAGQRRAESVVRREQRRGLRQLGRALLQQARPDAFAHLQPLRQLAARIALDAGAQRQQPGRLQRQQHGQRQRHHAGGQAPGREGRQMPDHGAPSVMARAP